MHVFSLLPRSLIFMNIHINNGAAQSRGDFQWNILDKFERFSEWFMAPSSSCWGCSDCYGAIRLLRYVQAHSAGGVLSTVQLFGQVGNPNVRCSRGRAMCLLLSILAWPKAI